MHFCFLSNSTEHGVMLKSFFSLLEHQTEFRLVPKNLVGKIFKHDHFPFKLKRSGKSISPYGGFLTTQFHFYDHLAGHRKRRGAAIENDGEPVSQCLITYCLVPSHYYPPLPFLSLAVWRYNLLDPNLTSLTNLSSLTRYYRQYKPK